MSLKTMHTQAGNYSEIAERLLGIIESYKTNEDLQGIKRYEKILTYVMTRYRNVISKINTNNDLLEQSVRGYDHAHLEFKVCEFYQIPSKALSGKSHKRVLVQARNILMVCSHLINGDVLEDAGRRYNRDHSTVIHAIKNVSNNFETNDFWARKMKEFCLSYNTRYHKDYVNLHDVLQKLLDKQKNKKKFTRLK